MSPAAKKTTRKRRKKAAPSTRGLLVEDVADGREPQEMAALRRTIDAAHGHVLGAYRDPLGGRWLALAALPLDAVAPTPFQRDRSDPHVLRLSDAIDKLDVFLDPVIAVPSPDDGGFWVPNGNHRLGALQKLGARSIVALVSPDAELAYRILALNTEKAHTLRERAMEVARMYRGLIDASSREPESSYALEFEEPALATLGFAYEQNARFAGAAYHPTLRRVEEFSDDPLPRALKLREKRAAALLKLDEAVADVIKKLKARGFESPYLRNFVVARIRPWHPRSTTLPDADEAIAKMAANVAKFNTEKIRPDQIASSGGPTDD